ncbi:MAG: hypothetical protein Q9191_001795 [Dirinaria sp. TL-2023a]
MAIAGSTHAMDDLYQQAQSRIPSSVFSPRHWIKSYEDFVQKNTSQVSQIESALRSLTYILPVHTTINLLSTYHTSLLPSPSQPTPHTRYTTHHRVRSRLYARSSTLLRTIQYTELLCEMFFKRRGGDKARWRLVVLLEIIKAICRTIMLKITGWKMNLSPAVPDQRASEEETRSSEDSENELGEVMNGGPPEEIQWRMPRTKHRLSPLPEPGASIQAYLSTRVVSPDTIKHASLLVRRLSTYQAQAAELLYIARPVIYALAMQRLQGNKRDWRPWAIGLVMEVAARQLAKRELREHPGGMSSMTSVERDEWSKRGWSVAWWGMRGAFYENVTRAWIQGFADRLKGKPLLDLVGGVIEDYEYLWNEYYFSTATM